MACDRNGRNRILQCRRAPLGQFIGVQLTSNLFIEMQWYLYSLVFFLGFAYILENGINVRVDFIYANWSKKRKALLDSLGTYYCFSFLIA